MSTEIDNHISKKYEIKKRLGKGVSWVEFCLFETEENYPPFWERTHPDDIILKSEYFLYF
jgi:hypothetical protein